MKNLREITRLELIETEIFLHDDDNESNPCNIYVDGQHEDGGSFWSDIRYYAVDFNFKVRVFRLTGPIGDAGKRILEYRLGETPLTQPTLGDVFMQGEFITELK